MRLASACERGSGWPEPRRRGWLVDDAVVRRWRVFVDRVMRVVSLERKGGFIQVAREVDGARLGAARFSGLQLTVCGVPGSYFVRLRSADRRSPWQHYAAPLPVTATWQTLSLPWRIFMPASLEAPLDASTLARIGIVAGQAAFDADIAIGRLVLVP